RHAPAANLIPYTTLFRSVAESSEVVEINETTELIEETTEPTQENKNLDENNVLVNYPYTLEFDNAIYDIKSIKHETGAMTGSPRSEEHTSELQSRFDLVC